MASKGYLSTLLNALPGDTRKILQQCFDHVCDTIQLGTATKAANFSWYRCEAITSSAAGAEFTVAHNTGSTPTRLIPVLDLGVVNAQLVPLVVTRAADDKRVYLSSSSTNAGIVFYVEVS